MSGTDVGRTPDPITADCPRPVRRPVMLQGWHDLASVHWRFDPQVVQQLLPPAFTVDTFDGSAWVGLIPFWMDRIRIPHLPPFGRWSSFPETNIRTYITDPSGRRGVWFFSLDVTRLAPTLVARVGYRLPYCWSEMSIERQDDRRIYESRRRWPRGTAASSVGISIGDPIAPDDVTPLEHFLTARWALGSTLAGRPIWAEVDHGPWPLHRATLLACDESLVEAAGLPSPTGDPVVLWSSGVEVRIGRPRLLRRR